jgi:DNA-binding NarL/FixJ family response regulator
VCRTRWAASVIQVAYQRRVAEVPLRESSDSLRILLADEQSLLREALRVVLEAEPDLRVVADVRDGLQAVAEADRARPDVALLHASLPSCDGISAIGLIKERVPNCKVVVFTDEEDQDALTRALEAGANGYLTKESPVDELIEALRAVHRGDTLVPSRMLGRLFDGLLRHRRDQDAAIRLMSDLTRREKEVLALLAEGAGNGAIAEALVISPETARTHIQNVLSKLGVHSRLEAATFVMQNGILDHLVPAPR